MVARDSSHMIHQAPTPPSAIRQSWQPWLFPYFAVCAFAMTSLSCCFVHSTTGAAAGTSWMLELSDHSCNWREQLSRANPFGCLKPRFTVSALQPTQANDGACRGPLVDHVFDLHQMGSSTIDLVAANSIARDITQRMAIHSSCGQGTAERAVKPHICFAHATGMDVLDKDGTGRFIGCLVRGKPLECRDIFCI